MKKTVNVKKNILPHTQAKLDLFKGYLEHYLRVLSHAKFCQQINLFDIFCGAGIYDDGKKGSPLLAVDCIRDINIELQNNGKSIKKVCLTVNDYDATKIENVKTNVDICNIDNCSVEFFNKDANEMLDIVATKVSSSQNNHRNLVFIDPYGYSVIKKDKILNLLKNKHTEIILFLPVMQMYRFTNAALNDMNNKPYFENLREFINSFFSNDNKIITDNIFDYIHSIKDALSINHTYYTCSHYIEREKGNYYALFFIGSNIYGLEKMIETKWKLDPVKGKGFNQEKTPSLFDTEFKAIDKIREISYLENIIWQSIEQKSQLNNIELYEMCLLNEFLPKHANEAIKNLQKKNKIKEINNSIGFGISYQNYKIQTITSTFIIL
jgi:three-Cys-motif partner protein